MKVVIIGGDAAGMSAAMEIVRSGVEAHIIVLEMGETYSIGQCGLPYVIDGRVADANDLIARTVEDFRDKYGIEARIYYEVQSIDTVTKTVSGVHAITKVPFSEDYDRLLIASGASPIMPNFVGHELAGIHHVKTLLEMDRLMHDLLTVKHVTVIGGGYIGLEVVEALTLRGLAVTLIQGTRQLMPTLDAKFTEHVLVEALTQGVEVFLGENVHSFEGAARVETVVTDKRRITTDLVIVATGIQPNTQFAQGFEKLSNGALLVNEHMETSVADIYAAGDCASHFHRILQRPSYLALGTTANKQGRIAGKNIAGGKSEFKGIVGTSIIKFFDLQIGMTGITEKQANELQIEIDSFNYEANNVASYYPTVQKLHFKVLKERATDRLLGLQMIGQQGVDKRIDVFATALYNDMKFAELVDLDLAYAPPFNGVWDALQQVSKRYS